MDRTQFLLAIAMALFSLGLLGVLTRRNAVNVLMGIELILNSANINLVAFWRYLYSDPAHVAGLAFVVIICATAAAEVAVGLALIVQMFKSRRDINVDEMNSLKG